MRSKILSVTLTACLAFAVGLAWATPDGEYVLTATGGVRICPATAGPILIEALADGDATIKLVSTSRSDRTYPDDGLGDSGAVFNLRDGQPRPFYVQGDKIDSLYVDISGGATEVVLTWTMN